VCKTGINLTFFSAFVLFTVAREHGYALPVDKFSLQDTIVPFDDFQPKPLTCQEKYAGLCTVSQYSTQGARFDYSELLSGCQEMTSNPTHKASEEIGVPSVNNNKRRRLSVPSKAGDPLENIGRADRQLDSSSVPDVADAIEVLSSKASSNQFMHFTFKGHF
jgi:topoisomerase (DNA) II binding protein 1